MEIASKKEPVVRSYRLLGLLLVPVLIFTLLSLATYDWRDIDWLQVPPNTPSVNVIGPAGAWAIFIGYNLLGMGLWIVPLWVGVAGMVLMFDCAGDLWRRAGWNFVFLAALCALLQLISENGVVAYWLSLNNLGPNAGGAVGKWMMTCSLEQWLSPVGGGLLAGAVLLFSGVMAIGPVRLVTSVRRLYEGWKAWRARQAEVAAQRAAVLAEQEQVVAEQDAAKAAEQGFGGKSARVRSEPALRRERKPAVDDRQTERAKPPPPAVDPATAAQAEEDERRMELRRRAEEARAASRQAAEQAAREAAEQRRAAEKAGGKAEAGARKPAVAPEPPASDAAAAVVAPFAHYRLPEIALLDPIPAGSAEHGDTAAMSKLLVDTLAQFNLMVEVTHVEPGPVVTRYELLPAAGIKVERIAQLANTLQMVLKATSLRIQAPVPGKNVVGVEVPNPKARMVTLREILHGGAWATNKMEIPLALGKDVGGADMVFDLASAPHLLVAGATGSGKSVCLNAILAGLLMSRRPDELRLLLVDPKRVEFPPYNNLPHLLVPVVTDAKKVAFALRWAIAEMDRRYKMMQVAKVRNIVSYNSRAVTQQTELPLDGAGTASAEAALPARMPYIVIVIDEVADLMITVGQEIEQSITRLAQLSRAVGIHMILATQRPSVNVITGTIKANFPGRIAFQVAQKTDSRTILDQSGAETLIGRGDMLFLNPKNGRLIRSQGALVNDSEIVRLTEFIRAQAGASFDLSLSNKLDKVVESAGEDEDEAGEGGGATGGGALPGGDGEEGADEELIQQSIQVIRDTRRASTSSLQRRLRIGYTRAARVMDILEERGVVGPTRGAEPREILIDLDAGMPDTPGFGGTPGDAAKDEP